MQLRRTWQRRNAASGQQSVSQVSCQRRGHPVVREANPLSQDVRFRLTVQCSLRPGIFGCSVPNGGRACSTHTLRVARARKQRKEGDADINSGCAKLETPKRSCFWRHSICASTISFDLGPPGARRVDKSIKSRLQQDKNADLIMKARII